jgi:hypothetical protein
MRRETTLPAARPGTEFLLEELPGELLVYDQIHHRAHCLTPALAALWKLCDGRTTLRQAQAALPGLDLREMIGQLERAQLVRTSRPTGTNRSRRRFVRKTAVAAGIVLASPVIFSIVAPSVAEAASCGTKGLPCCPGNTCEGIMNAKNCIGGVCVS